MPARPPRAPRGGRRAAIRSTSGGTGPSTSAASREMAPSTYTMIVYEARGSGSAASSASPTRSATGPLKAAPRMAGTAAGWRISTSRRSSANAVMRSAGGLLSSSSDARSASPSSRSRRPPRAAAARARLIRVLV
ncbi:hypothetical protein [Nonomuraea rubra]|uniref:Uncharacterized protein n=2 Tax=Nonomuraea rubra TaxID=46180 RepID=A0A7X0NN22_9ACTN|nr:hypothetical protein [Nonomuraea rubra]MBB6546442.1 hypothetical protein [Nonomuraea rubra]